MSCEEKGRLSGGRPASGRTHGPKTVPYSPPRLTRWGSVWELTKGGAGLFADFPMMGTRKDT